MRSSVLFVSNTSQVERPFKDPSTRYRCFTPASALARRGHKTAVTSQRDFERNPAKYENFEYFVFHRPMMNEALGVFLAKMNNSPRIIADFDDYIFQVKDAWLTPAYRFRGESITNTARYLARNAAAMRYFGRFTLSTTPLAKEVRRIVPTSQIEVFSNTLDPGYQGAAQLIRERTRGIRREFRFGYFAGTATHDQDLADIAPALASALDAVPDSRMLVLGPANIPAELTRFGIRVEHRSSVVPFHRLPAMMAQVETVIAPLERNAFTESKSGLKFFEAAAVGCSVVATPIADIDRFESSLLRKCETTEQWLEALTKPFQLDPPELEAEARRVVSLVDADAWARLWETYFVGE